MSKPKVPFKSFEHELARRGGASNPNALAQTIGRAKRSERAPVSQPMTLPKRS